MGQKPQIRIVKGGRQSEAEQKPAAAEKESRKEARRGARAVAENVSAWVEEFKEQRKKDTGRTFASLFAERPQTLNSPA